MSDHLFQPEAFEQIPGQLSMTQGLRTDLPRSQWTEREWDALATFMGECWDGRVKYEAWKARRS